MANQNKDKKKITIFHDIGKIFRFIYNSIGNLFHIIGEIIYTGIQHIRSVFYFGNQKIEERKDFIKEDNKVYQKQKSLSRKQQNFQDALSFVLFNKTSHHTRITKHIILFATFSLQIISLTTTYRGARYYLLDLNPLAPFLFASVVQILLFYFSKEAGEQYRMKVSRYIIFTSIVMLSVLTSYVGIVNNTISPLNDYKNQYTAYQNDFYKAKNNIKQLYGDYVSYDRAIDSLENQVKQLISITNNSIEGLNVQSGTLGQIQPSTSITTSNANGIDSITQTTDQSELTKALEKIAHNEEKVEKLNNAIKNLETAISNKNLNAMKKEMEKIGQGHVTTFSNNSHATMKNIVLHYNMLLETLNSFLKEANQPTLKSVDTLQLNLDQLQNLVSSYEKFNELNLEPIQNLQKKHNIMQATDTKEKIGIFDNLVKTILPFKDLHQEEYQKFRTDLELQISQSYYELKAYSDKLTFINPDKVKLIQKDMKNSFNKYASFTDITVIAFQRFTENEINQKSAIICMVIASIIDVLSAILPFFWFHRYVSSLYRKKRKHRNPEEELLESLFYAMAKEVPMNVTNMENSMLGYYEYMYNVLKHLNDYFKIYKELPYFEAYGYVLYAKRKDIEKEEYHNINALLTTFHYINTISECDIMKQCEKQYNFSNGYENQKVDDYVYIMQKDVVLWLNQHLYKILQNQEFMFYEKRGETI